MRVHCKYTPTGVTEDWHHIGILIMQLLCRNDDLTYFLGEEKNVVYGSCKRLWFWVDGRLEVSNGLSGRKRKLIKPPRPV